MKDRHEVSEEEWKEYMRTWWHPLVDKIRWNEITLAEGPRVNRVGGVDIKNSSKEVSSGRNI